MSWTSRVLFWGRPAQLPRLNLSVGGNAIALVRVGQWTAAVVSLVAMMTAAQWWHEGGGVEETATHLDSVVHRLTLANAQLSQTMTREGLTLSADDLAVIKQDVLFVNQLTEKRKFSWSRLLNDLETTLPPRIALRSVRLNFQDSTVALHGSAASLQDIKAFMTSLEHHAAFRHAALASHRLQTPTSQHARPLPTSEIDRGLSLTDLSVEFDLSVLYRPSF